MVSSVLARLAIEEPGKLAQIAYGLLPKDVFISVEQRTPGFLDPDKWRVLVDLVRLNPGECVLAIPPGRFFFGGFHYGKFSTGLRGQPRRLGGSL
jgi:hypothetical protein